MDIRYKLRSVQPSVARPDSAFVEQLRQRLRARAEVLSNTTTSIRSSKKQPWFRWGIASFATAVATMVMVVFVPKLFIPTRTVSGYIQKGPYITGSSITIQELDDNLQPTGKNYQVTTSSDFGDYVLQQKMRSQYVEVIASGYYYNEVQGSVSSAPLTLRAIAAVGDNQAVNVNVLTSLTVQRLRYLMARDNKTFAVAKQQAEQEVLHFFKIDNSKMNTFETMNISKAGENNAALLAVSVMLQGQQSVGEVSELLSKLNLDLENDGDIDSASALVTTIENNTSSLNSYSIRKNLQARFQKIGVDNTVPEFEKFITPFTASTDPFAYQITLANNIFPENHAVDAKIELIIHGTHFEQDQEEVALKNLFSSTKVTYVDEQTVQAEFPITQLTPGSYTVVVRNQTTGRTGVTDGEPIEAEPTATPEHRLIIQGRAPTITTVTPSTVPYLTGDTIAITGEHFTYGTFVWINHWQVPQAAIRAVNSKRIEIDLSPALIANNAALPRQQLLSITVQTPDFQKAEYSGFEIQ